MRTNGNDIIIHRGEGFTIDRQIVNRDGSPYIISSEYSNPYLLLTITSSKYDQTRRYNLNYWLDLKDVKRFQVTSPIDTYDEDSMMRYLEDNERDVTEWPNYLFYFNSNNTYVYYDLTANGPVTYKGLRFVKTFSPIVTKNWVEQSYFYSITLVSGQNTRDYLISTYRLYYYDDVKDKSNEELYDKIKLKNPDLLVGIDVFRPIINFEVSKPIVPSSKLTVLSNLEEEIYE